MLEQVARTSPFRHLTTPGGATMSVAMTNCGRLGWVSGRHGYRYTTNDPTTGLPWPPMPPPLPTLAAAAAATAGYSGFAPDACLLNRYVLGSRLALHQDRDERDLSAPIVSISLGLPATFLFGGALRTDPIRRIRLESGDVVVWGSASRLTGARRLNPTFRVIEAGQP